jgi:enoyl-CoA hydratase/carnithine racemase
MCLKFNVLLHRVLADSFPLQQPVVALLFGACFGGGGVGRGA